MLVDAASIARGIGILGCGCNFFLVRSGDAEAETSRRPKIKGDLEMIADLVGVG